MTVTPVAPQLTPFIDAEKAIVLLLADLVATGSIDTETPNNLQSILPFVRVSRIGGQSSQFASAPHIDVDVFGARGARTVASNLALACEARLLSFPHVIPGVGVIDTVVANVSPNEVPWANADIRLFVSTYQVTVRR